MRFIAITPGDGRDLVPWLGAVAPWADGVILREPDATETELMNWVDVVRRSGSTAIRHARARPVDADLVHFPDGVELPTQGRFGASRHTADGVRHALDAGCEYVLLSPVFNPTSKPATSPPLGLNGFASMASDPRVVALAGIDAERARRIALAGHGVAVLGHVFGAPTPAAAGQRAANIHRVMCATRTVGTTSSGVLAAPPR